MDTKKICKIGNSPAIRLNGTLLSAVSKLSDGDTVNVEYQKDKIIIRKVVK